MKRYQVVLRCPECSGSNVLASPYNHAVALYECEECRSVFADDDDCTGFEKFEHNDPKTFDDRVYIRR